MTVMNLHSDHQSNWIERIGLFLARRLLQEPDADCSAIALRLIDKGTSSNILLLRTAYTVKERCSCVIPHKDDLLTRGTGATAVALTLCGISGARSSVTWYRH